MYKNCTTERSALQQHTFEQTLLAMMQAKPFTEISVSELCQAAALSRKTFYRLFGKKEDVLYALVDHTLLEFTHYSPDTVPTEDPLQRELYLFFAFWKQHKPLMDALSGNRLLDLLIDRSLLYIAREETGVLRHFHADNSDCGEEILAFFISGITSLLIHWYQTGFRRSEAEMARIMAHLMLTPPVQF